AEGALRSRPPPGAGSRARREPCGGEPGGCRARPRDRLHDRGPEPTRKCAKSGLFEPRSGARQPPNLIHFRCLAKPLFCRHFLIMAKTQAKAGYSAKDITVLEGLEPVRLRPGMYIGSTGLRGLHHLVEEIVVNSVDEALAGYNDSIEITIHPDNSVTVRDRGRGIPVDVVEGTGTSALEVIMTKLHAGGKFGGDGYKVSGGLHGVGASVVNALSEWLVVEVSRDSKVYRQEFDRGVPRGPMQIV